MRFKIMHEIGGRIRIHVLQNKMTDCEADILQYYLENITMVKNAKVYERTQDAVIWFSGDRMQLLGMLQRFSYTSVRVPDSVLEFSGRKMNRDYLDKLAGKVIMRFGSRFFLPCSLRNAMAVMKSVKYVCRGVQSLLKRKIEVPLLDGIAVSTSILRRDMNTAGSVMFLLPFDGIVVSGEGMVNQSSLTGEAIPVVKKEDGYVYAGTVLEEGELTMQVKETSGTTRYEKIVSMIEETEKLKSTVESRAEHLADRLVPYTLLGTGMVYLFTGNVTKALSVLMVDFSCVLKLAMPIAVLSAMKEADEQHITVKGGKFLEAVAEADTVIFDKTGTILQICRENTPICILR